MSLVSVFGEPIVEYIPIDEVIKRCKPIFKESKQKGDAKIIADEIAKETRLSATYIRLCREHKWDEPLKLARAKNADCMKIIFDDLKRNTLYMDEKNSLAMKLGFNRTNKNGISHLAKNKLK